MHSTTTRHGSFCSLACPYQSTPGCRHREAATTKRLANTRRILRARYGQAGAVDSAMRCLRERGQCVGRLCRSCGAADLHKVDHDDGVDLRHERDQLGNGAHSPAASCTTCAAHVQDELQAGLRNKFLALQSRDFARSFTVSQKVSRSVIPSRSRSAAPSRQPHSCSFAETF